MLKAGFLDPLAGDSFYVSMVTELCRAVNYFPGNCQKPIKLEILATAASVDFYSLIVIGFMRKGC